MLAASMNGDHGDGGMNTNGNARRRYRRAAKRDTNDLTGLRAGLYVRVSRDPDPDKKRKKEDVEKYIAKQTEDQKKVGLEWARRTGVIVADVYSDPDFSASIFATKERPEFKRLRGDIEAGKLDAVWFWEHSRSQRRLDVFTDIRDLCQRMGVLWVIRDRVYDPDNYQDMLALGLFSLIGENESNQTSERVLRGKQSSAEKGLPPGRLPYGYRPVYDSRTRKFDRGEPDVFDGEDRPLENSPAWVVREIFTRLAAGNSARSIIMDLNARNVRTRYGKTWGVAQISYIAQNPTYIARRFHQAGQWVP
jgi:site-specific DNA recombinase